MTSATIDRENEKMITVKLPNTLTDHPSLIGIIRLPAHKVNGYGMDIPVIVKENGKYKNVVQTVQMASLIEGYNGIHKQLSDSYTVSKSSVTDFYPYTYYVLTDGECEPLTLQPQYMPNVVNITGVSSLSHQPVERYYVEGYKGDNTGNIYNITNVNQMMLPTASNEGISYLNANANTISQNRKSAQLGNILNGVGAIGQATIGGFVGGGLGAVAGVMNGVKNIVSGIDNIKQIDSRNRDMMLTPSSISSFGTPSTRESFGTNKARLLKYTVSQNVKNKVKNFIERYGNKYNNYGIINHKEYKGYIKMIEPKIIGDIDNIYLNKIIEIFERGVYIE